jgi:hypothetical protein
MSERKRTPGQLLAEAELKSFFFKLRSVEDVTWDRDGEPSYLWKFESIGRRYRAYVTIRTKNPGLFSFETEYGWNEMRRYRAHVHDYGKLNTRL